MFENDGNLSIVVYDPTSSGGGCEERDVDDIADSGSISLVCSGWSRSSDTVWPGIGTDDWGVRQQILEEAHKSKFSIHPGTTKMYRALRLSYWWPCMNEEIAWIVERCMTCRKVKAEHQRPHVKV